MEKMRIVNSQLSLMIDEKIKELQKIKAHIEESGFDASVIDECIGQAQHISTGNKWIDSIVSAVKEVTGVLNLNAKTRQHEVVYARQLAHYFAYTYTRISESDIGRLIGNKDHSTVFHSAKKIHEKMKIAEKIKGNMYDYLTSDIGNIYGILKKEFIMTVWRVPENRITNVMEKNKIL